MQQQTERPVEPRETPGQERDLSLGVLGMAAVMAAVEKPEPRQAQPRR